MHHLLPLPHLRTEHLIRIKDDHVKTQINGELHVAMEVEVRVMSLKSGQDRNAKDC